MLSQLTQKKNPCPFYKPAVAIWRRPVKKSDLPLPTRDVDGYPLHAPRVKRKEDVQRERPLTDYENQLLREIQELKSRQEILVAPTPPSPPPKYSGSVQNWQKGLETVGCDFRTGLPSDGLF